ncbi:hypothetical protein [Halosegnis longus]|uniref:hypothetical protein n=1 Tax=Halosegnis longus TaxID=2216012 RepID=UPI00129D9C26|nr:hypothetical protein [Halosegnis longus]
MTDSPQSSNRVSIPAHYEKRVGSGMYAGYRETQRWNWVEQRELGGDCPLPFYTRVDRDRSAMYDPDGDGAHIEMGVGLVYDLSDDVVVEPDSRPASVDL